VRRRCWTGLACIGGKYAVQYFNTNHSPRAGRHHVLGGKTGYTDTARCCLAIAAELAGRRVGMVFLGAEGELTRFGDFNRAAAWTLDGGPARGKAPAAAAGASCDPPPAALVTKVAP
jgi:D-alanyl-D-alanine carboxypeptidase